MAALDLSARINLNQARVLVLDGNPQSLDVLRRILNGFGVRSVHACQQVQEAERIFREQPLDLIVIDPLFEDDSGFAFMRFTRREETSPNRCVGMIAALGHHTHGNVCAARDAGANIVVAKPLTPEVLLHRIFWIAGESRQFIVAPNYVGPDRRFKNQGPPLGTSGRRADDLSFDVPVSAGPDLPQSEIDEMFKPMKVSL